MDHLTTPPAHRAPADHDTLVTCALAEAPAEDRPTHIAGYRLGDTLGRGGMGIVYRAADARLGRWVALKVLGRERDDLTCPVRCAAEVRAAAAVDHPNVLPVYGAGVDDGIWYLATRLVTGPTLTQLLIREAPGARRGLAIVSQVGAALAAVHAAGLCHRDVKPANVLVAPGATGDHAYLTDFGLATPIGVTPRVCCGGTPGYQAPEQRGGGPARAETDVFGLAKLAEAVLGGRGARTLPGGAASVIARATHDDPDHRHPDVETFMADLKGACRPVRRPHVHVRGWRLAGAA